MSTVFSGGRYISLPSSGSVNNPSGNSAGQPSGGGSIPNIARETSSSSSSSSASSSAAPPVVSSPSVGSTGLSGPSTGSNTAPRSTSVAPPPIPSPSIDTNSNARQTTSASNQSSSSSNGLIDFEQMFNYQKRINQELDMPTLRETNQEGYKYRKLESDDQMGRDTSARRDAAALAMQRDVLSSDLERGTMRQQQALQTRTKDQDLARAMSITMKGRR